MAFFGVQSMHHKVQHETIFSSEFISCTIWSGGNYQPLLWVIISERPTGLAEKRVLGARSVMLCKEKQSKLVIV